MSRPVNKCSIADAAFDLMADLVRRKRLAFSFQLARNRVMASSKRATLSKLPRQMARAMIRPNQRSTKLSHTLVGVKCRWKRGCATSHCLIAGCLWFRSCRRSDCL